MLCSVVMFLITPLLAFFYHNYDFYESIIHFIMFMIFHIILAYAFVNFTNTSLPTLKTFIKESCGRLIFLLDYVKNLVDDTSSLNRPNPHAIIPNLIVSSPSINPRSSHNYDGIQAIV